MTPEGGRIEWIAVRPQRRQPPLVVRSVLAIANRGFEGDRASVRSGKPRQVSLIQAEHLPMIAQQLDLPPIDPALLRRNLVVSGTDLLALRFARFRIGEALFETTGLCDPCSRMEEALGEGGFEAMRDRGGITARVLVGGLIRVGDALVPEPVVRLVRRGLG